MSTKDPRMESRDGTRWKSTAVMPSSCFSSIGGRDRQEEDGTISSFRRTPADRKAFYTLLALIALLLWPCGVVMCDEIRTGGAGLESLVFIVLGLPLAACGLGLPIYLYRKGSSLLPWERLLGYFIGILSLAPYGFHLYWNILELHR